MNESTKRLTVASLFLIVLGLSSVIYAQNTITLRFELCQMPECFYDDPDIILKCRVFIDYKDGGIDDLCALGTATKIADLSSQQTECYSMGVAFDVLSGKSFDILLEYKVVGDAAPNCGGTSCTTTTTFNSCCFDDTDCCECAQWEPVLETLYINDWTKEGEIIFNLPTLTRTYIINIGSQDGCWCCTW